MYAGTHALIHQKHKEQFDDCKDLKLLYSALNPFYKE